MSDETKPPAAVTPEPNQEFISAFSVQPTGMVETTSAETLGLSMHNAVVTQQNSQMIAQASITNACARLLTVPSATKIKAMTEDQADETEADDQVPAPFVDEPIKQKQPRKLKIGNFFKRKKNKKTDEGQTAEAPKGPIKATESDLKDPTIDLEDGAKIASTEE